MFCMEYDQNQRPTEECIVHVNRLKIIMVLHVTFSVFKMFFNVFAGLIELLSVCILYCALANVNYCNCICYMMINFVNIYGIVITYGVLIQNHVKFFTDDSKRNFLIILTGLLILFYILANVVTFYAYREFKAFSYESRNHRNELSEENESEESEIHQNNIPRGDAISPNNRNIENQNHISQNNYSLEQPRVINNGVQSHGIGPNINHNSPPIYPNQNYIPNPQPIIPVYQQGQGQNPNLLPQIQPNIPISQAYQSQNQNTLPHHQPIIPIYQENQRQNQNFTEEEKETIIRINQHSIENQLDSPIFRIRNEPIENPSNPLKKIDDNHENQIIPRFPQIKEAELQKDEKWKPFKGAGIVIGGSN